MKYMIEWRIPTGSHRAAADAFLSGGAPVPESLTVIGRWHAPGSAKGWIVVEGNDEVALAQHAGEWANLLEIEVTPVLGDEAAAQGLRRAYGG